MNTLYLSGPMTGLPGWLESSGAHLEVHIGHRVGMQIVEASSITESCGGKA